MTTDQQLREEFFFNMTSEFKRYLKGHPGTDPDSPENCAMRLRMINHFTAGYCIHCGRYEPKNSYTCHCQRDE